jgi:hypothetical protein
MKGRKATGKPGAGVGPQSPLLECGKGKGSRTLSQPLLVPSDAETSASLDHQLDHGHPKSPTAGKPNPVNASMKPTAAPGDWIGDRRGVFVVRMDPVIGAPRGGHEV